MVTMDPLVRLWMPAFPAGVKKSLNVQPKREEDFQLFFCIRQRELKQDKYLNIPLFLELVLKQIFAEFSCRIVVRVVK